MNLTSVDSKDKIKLSGDFDIEVSFSAIQASAEIRMTEIGASVSETPTGKQFSVGVDASGNLVVSYFNGSAWATL